MTRATPSAALLLLASVLPACAEAPTPVAPPAPFAATPPDEGAAHHAADVAIASLSRRKYNVTGCAAAEARLVADVDAEAAPAAGCSVVVARRPDRTWLVVIRSSAQLGNVSARVTVLAGGEGVQHIDYKP